MMGCRGRSSRATGRTGCRRGDDEMDQEFDESASKKNVDLLS
jgi:hypothetical protein